MLDGTPADWRIAPLSTVISDVRGGFSVNCAERAALDGEVGVLKTGAVANGAFDPTQNKLALPAELSRVRAPVCANTIIFCRKNSEDMIGKTSLVEADHPNLFLSDLLWELRPAQGVSIHWLDALMKSHLVTGIVRVRATGTQSSMKNISQDRLLSILVPVPSAAEQRKIAEILRTWDEAIEACQRLIASKQRWFASARQRLYAPTRPGADAAGSWGETTLGAIFTEIGELNPGLGPEAVITVGKYAIRRQVEHFTRSVASANLGNYQLLTPGDFVYDPMSAYYGAIGRYASDELGIVSPAYTVIRLADGINPAFTEGLLKSHYIAFELDSRSSQGNREGKRRTLRSDEFSSIPFMLPQRDEQDRIAGILGDIARDLELTTNSRDTLAKQKRGLMQKLLTGEWRVKVEKEAAHG